jgi:hypothetical protein
MSPVRRRGKTSGGDSKPTAASREMDPDQRPVTRAQAEYLAGIAEVPAEKLVGRPIAELADVLKWKIDPELLLFRRVCGRVVRRDPGTGVIQGVPNATVHVEDTDCSFLGFFPVENPWWWFWPISCRREEIATTTTDACGNFCVYIPRWDIDRILRLRLKRICFPDIVKPNLRDLIGDIVLERKPPFPVDPNPPDPPWDRLDADTLRQLGSLAGPGVAERLATVSARSFGDPTDELTEILDGPAFTEGILPPLDDAALGRLKELRPTTDDKPRRAQSADPLVGASLVDIVGRDRIVGPFLRCRDVLVLEWQLIFDVPDITFRVSQDVDLDGDEENIYSEGYFDVRWNAGAIPNVVLEASPIARPSPICEGPDFPCVNQPAIRTVGLMTLDATHHDSVNGYSIRVNRPHPNGLSTGAPSNPAQAPYAGTLQLHGCHHIGGAPFYRLQYAFEGAGYVPFTGLEWWAPRIGPGGPIHVAPDSNGWYDVLPEGDLVFPHWLLNWPSTWYPNGKYDVKLQLGNAVKNVIDESAAIGFVVDNRAPHAFFSQIRWRPTGGSWQDTFTWPFQCPVIRRHPHEDIEIEVSWWASAVHFRDAVLSGGGCGGGDITPVLPPISDFDHWHTNPADNGFSRVALFSLPGTALEGSYTFSIDAHTRAFNPAGDGGGAIVDWYTDYAYSHAHPSIAVSVINA